MPSRWSEVIGVAEDILPAINDGWPAPTVYELFASRGHYVDRVVARSKGSAADAVRDLEKVLASADPSIIIVASSTVADEIASVRFTRRLAVWILGMAGLLSVALAAIGLYGIVSYSLAQRMREFGVRAALGASARNLIRLVLREALVVASIGSVIGLIAAYAAVGLVSNRLVAIPSVNVLIVIAALAVVYGAVLAACYLPARRAARVDPIIVLRGL
jgi:putative ABC transport system permease protein